MADVLLQPDDLRPGQRPTQPGRPPIRQGLAALVDPPNGILRVEVRLPDGTVLWASDPAIVGTKASPTAAFQEALDATAKADFVDGACVGGDRRRAGRSDRPAGVLPDQER